MGENLTIHRSLFEFESALPALWGEYVRDGKITIALDEDTVRGLLAARSGVEKLVDALTGLIEAVELDSKAQNSISGYTSARLSDAHNILERVKGKGESDG